MHQDYQFGRPLGGQSISGWQFYRGAVAAKVTMGLLGAGLLWHLLLLVGKLAAPSFFSGPAVGSVSAIGTLLIFGLTGVAFLVWFYRAYYVVDLAVGAAHRPNQAVWTFLVPAVNLYRPYQIATEIWRKSGSAPEYGHSGLLIGWWALWVIARSAPFLVTGHFTGFGGEGEGLLSSSVIFAGVAELALAGSAIAVVRTLDGRIRARQGRGTAPATF